MVSKLIKSTFIGGELSNKMQNRFDFDKYNSSAKFIENFNLSKEGNIAFRNGSYFISDLGTDDLEDEIPSRKVRLLNWIKNENTIYLLVFSNLAVKIYRDFELKTTLTTIYTLTDIFNLQIDYVGNNLYLVDGIHTPYLLNNINDVFTLNAIDFTTPPWDEENLSDLTMKASATTGTINIVASKDLFDNTHLHKYLKFKNAGNNATGFAKITEIKNKTTVKAIVKTTLPTTNAITDWNFSSSPASIIFYQSRLFFAKNNWLYGSRTQSNDGTPRFNDFTTGVDNDHAISLVNTMFKTPILWLKATDKTLFAGTTTTLFQLNNSTTNGYLTPSNLPAITPFSNDGCKNIPPLQINNNVFYVSVVGIQNDKGSRLNVLGYNFESNGYQVNNLNLFNEDINKEGIVEIAFLRNYDDLVYCLKANGEISCLNFDANQSILGWSRFTSAEFDRRKGNQNKDGVVESITALRQIDGSDLLVLCVRRYINGIVKRYLEYIPKVQVALDRTEYYTGNEAKDNADYLYDLYQLQLNLNHLDCTSIYNGRQAKSFTLSSMQKGESLITNSTYKFTINDLGREIKEVFDYNNQNGVAEIIDFIDETSVKINIKVPFYTKEITQFILTTDKITNLEYLENKTVYTWIDGGVGREHLVKNGSINLQYQGAFILVGLKYLGKIQTLNFNQSFQDGNTIDLKKHLNKINIFFYNTVSCKVGTSLYKTDQLYISPSETLGKVSLIFNGVKNFILKDNPEESKYLFILKDDFSPCTIQFINIHINYA